MNNQLNLCDISHLTIQINKTISILTFSYIKRPISWLISFALLIYGCVEPYNLKYNINQSVVIIDATITDEDGEQNIVLKESMPNGSSSSIVAMSNAQVEVMVNGREKVLFTERPTDPGTYLAPMGFKAKFGNTYLLFVTSEAGDKFESSVETIKKGAEIKGVSQSFEKITIKEKNTTAYAHKIYVDTQDPVGNGDFYAWTWKLFESQSICRTCEPGQRYYITPAPAGRCVSDLPNFLRNVIYDYNCNAACWEIIYSLKGNIMSDEFVDGKLIANRLVAEIPLYNLNSGALIEIKQQSLSLDSYKYLKILIDQNQNSGGLADTPPASLIGNVRTLSSNARPVAGYFRVTDETVIRYWIDRTTIPSGVDIIPVGLLNGRLPNFEPQSNDTTRPPLAPCLPGYTRTNVKPEGWVEVKPKN